MRVLRISHSATVGPWRARERALRGRGEQIELITARRWHAGGAEVMLDDAEPWVRPASTLGRHPALFLYSPGPLWQALGEQWDVIDIHEEPFALATAEVLLLRWLRRQTAPFVLYSAQNIRKRYPVPFRWFERMALRAASGLSVCNSEAGAICVDKGFSGRPQLVPLGVETERMPDDAGRPAVADDEPIVVGSSAGSSRRRACRCFCARSPLSRGCTRDSPATARSRARSANGAGFSASPTASSSSGPSRQRGCPSSTPPSMCSPCRRCRRRRGPSSSAGSP